MVWLITLMLSVFLVSCEDTQSEQEIIAQHDKKIQDSIEVELQALREREQAAKDLRKNVEKMCQFQLLVLENGSPEDSLRLHDYALEMKRLYPNSNRKALRRVAMEIDSCEEFRELASKKRKS